MQFLTLQFRSLTSRRQATPRLLAILAAYGLLSLAPAAHAQGQPSAGTTLTAADSLRVQTARAHIGAQFITRGSRWAGATARGGMTAKQPATGEHWQCRDVIAAGAGEVLLVLRNERQEQITLPLPLVGNHQYIYPAAYVEAKRQEYGDDFWWEIMQGRAKRGMTAAMCREALGEPKSASQNRTMPQGPETWAYPDGTTIQFVAGRVESVRKGSK